MTTDPLPIDVPGDPPAGPRLRRLVGLAWLAVRIALTLALLALLPVLPGFVWTVFRRFMTAEVNAFILSTNRLWNALIAVGLLSTRIRWLVLWRVPDGAWPAIDRVFEWFLRRGLTLGLGGLVLFWFLSWVPHYLTWPFWSDTDHFALSALSWDRGILPYRDLVDFNFPGPFYIHGAIGNLFGWGRTLPYYALDAAMLTTLGMTLVFWSRRRFGDPLPGLVSALVFMGYYFRQNYATVAQRDWQATLFCVIGLILLDVGRGRRWRWGAGALFGAALAFRPHAVVFAPAFLMALWRQTGPVALGAGADPEGGDPPPVGDGTSIGSVFLRVLEWSVVAGVVLTLFFVPLIYEGILDDLIRNFQSAWYGGERNQGASKSFGLRIYEEVAPFRTATLLLVLVPLALRRDGDWGQLGRVWLLALLGAFVYRPLSPVGHGYLAQPRILLESISLGIAIGLFIRWRWPRASTKVILTMALIFDRTPWLPQMVQPRIAAEAVAALSQGRPILDSPPGCAQVLPTVTFPPGLNWEDYQRTLDYLRRQTDSQTMVANVIEVFPFPSVNSPVARLTPMPCAEGIQWVVWVAPEREAEFAESLTRRRERRTVVVWAPLMLATHAGRPLNLMRQTIRDHFEVEVQFGRFEIWRQKP